jgi:hypothetical protein
MGIKVMHTLICEWAEREIGSGKLNCRGIMEHLLAGQYPYTTGFNVLAWLKGVNEANNHFQITAMDAFGNILGKIDDHRAKHLKSDGEPDLAEMLLRFNSFTFQSAQDYFIIEVRHQGKPLFCKTIKALQAPGIMPTTPAGDQGYIRLKDIL